ncbi:hypothetical protein DUNSADRAFT_14318 [Dunaliella salina]|uniref:UBA domain-containing protein n=1 Tax=Dunaliella salina TaxID=3046 RepID=A0ABQ7G6F7_DUNSA|nr:hypothetical protein DUNSADRAFT_14318 [Dunaliella salina]|eukprot:KAF5830588.1 hypothetical protein DUNSADRAFT_14318 [Dunaliella salina]
MLHAEEMYVRTAMGGGQAGPLRVDLSRGRWAVQEYSLAEATAAFQRTLANHGWAGGGGRGGTAAGSSAAPAAAGASSSAHAAQRATRPSAAAAAATAAAGGPAPFSSSSAALPGPGLLGAGGLSGPHGSYSASRHGQVLSSARKAMLLHSNLNNLLNGPPNFTPTHSWTGPPQHTPNHLHVTSRPLLGSPSSQPPPPAPLFHPQRPPPPASVMVPTPAPAQPQATASTRNHTSKQLQPQPQAGTAAPAAAGRSISGSGTGEALASSSTPSASASAGREHDSNRRRTRLRALRGLGQQQQTRPQPQGRQQQQQQQQQQTLQQHVVDLTLDDDDDDDDGDGGGDDGDMDTFMPAPTAPVPTPTAPAPVPAQAAARDCTRVTSSYAASPFSAVDAISDAEFHAAFAVSSDDDDCEVGVGSKRNRTQPHQQQQQQSDTASRAAPPHKRSRSAVPMQNNPPKPLPTDAQQHTSGIAQQPPPHLAVHSANGAGSSSGRAVGRAAAPTSGGSMAPIEIDLTDDFPRIERRRKGEASSKQQQQQQQQHGHQIDRSDTRPARQPHPPPAGYANQQQTSAGEPQQRAPRAKSTHLQSSQVAAGLAELQSNGLTVMEARAALAAAGNDSRRALQRLVEERVLEPEAVATLVANGVSQQDAEAALMLKKGDANKALMLCIECNETGSHPSDLLRQKRRKADAAAEASKTVATEHAEAEEHRRKQLLLEQEAEMVLQRFEASGGLRRAKVRKIERVQNLQLYTDYDRSLRKIQHQTKGNPNVKSLFHDNYSKAPKHSWDVSSSRSGAMAMPPPIIPPFGMPPAMLFGSSMSGAALSSSLHTPWGMGGAVASGLRRPVPRKLPHKLLHGSHSHGRQQQQQQPPPADPSSPAFVEGCVAMLLCDVVMGVVGNGGPHMRRPPPNCHSTTGGNIFAVYDDTQAYPTHVIHYEP